MTASLLCSNRRIPRVSLFLATVSVIIASLSGCLSGPPIVSPLYQRMAGRGPIVLDDTNPDLPAQAFLSEQRKESPELSRFIQEHGQPTAVSVERKLYRKTRLGLYYPETGLVFFFTRGMRDWGEEVEQPITAQDLQRVSSQLEESGLPLPSPKAARSPVAQSQLSPSGGEQLKGHLKPPASAGEARLVRLPNGDYRHEVTFPGETLTLLAEWYCKNDGEAKALAVANGIRPDTSLSRGDAVTIPRRLMRNAQPLPEAALP